MFFIFVFMPTPLKQRTWIGIQKIGHLSIISNVQISFAIFVVDHLCQSTQCVQNGMEFGSKLWFLMSHLKSLWKWIEIHNKFLKREKEEILIRVCTYPPRGVSSCLNFFFLFNMVWRYSWQLILHEKLLFHLTYASKWTVGTKLTWHWKC